MASHCASPRRRASHTARHLKHRRDKNPRPSRGIFDELIQACGVFCRVARSWFHNDPAVYNLETSKEGLCASSAGDALVNQTGAATSENELSRGEGLRERQPKDDPLTRRIEFRQTSGGRHARVFSPTQNDDPAGSEMVGSAAKRTSSGRSRSCPTGTERMTRIRRSAERNILWAAATRSRRSEYTPNTKIRTIQVSGRASSQKSFEAMKNPVSITPWPVDAGRGHRV